MPKRSLKCVVDLNLHAISAPGVWLACKEELYLSVSMLGQYRNTHLMTSIFPLFINEKFRFEKTYYTAMDPSQIADYMEDELVIFELLQLSEYTDGAVRLASFSTNLRDFLYPYPSLAPTYTSSSRELLLSRTVAFPGIAPKLEFSTSTIIKQSLSPELDALDTALEEERRLRRLRIKSSYSPRRARSCGRRYVVPGLTERHMQPTLASISRSRSPSPYLSKRFEDIDLTETSTRPPFVVRKLNSDLIGRIPGGPAEKNAKMKKRRSRSLSRSLNEYNTRSSLGNYSDLEFDYTDYPSLRHRYHLSKVYRDLYDDPLPVYRSKYLADDDDDDAEVAELTSLRRHIDASTLRPRSVSPILYRSSFRNRFDRPYSPATSLLKSDRMNRTLTRLDRLSPVDMAPVLTRHSPYNYLSSDSLDDLAVETSLARSRSLVHVNDGEYWTEDAALLSGKSHRQLFNDNLGKMYCNLYNNARQ